MKTMKTMKTIKTRQCDLEVRKGVSSVILATEFCKTNKLDASKIPELAKLVAPLGFDCSLFFVLVGCSFESTRL